uniref:Retrotransposon Copia-like N-terminal domain-containing protein n=1 Tax=Cajanus cajan TaxID=3821 RepID=A0A151T5L8_CAJCA|nr:hypothetical protein KK1_016869 [Cajanus cajan]
MIQKKQLKIGLSKITPSPYDINSSNNPRSVIIQVQFQGENYKEWAQVMWTSFYAQRKQDFIDEIVEQPQDKSSKMEDWWTVQLKLILEILNIIEPNFPTTISYTKNVKDVWYGIEERFSIVKGPIIQQLRSYLV